MVVLWHEVTDENQFARGSHYDLMLERDGALLTWAIGTWPPEPAERYEVIKLADHRLAYLEYEGPISGNRGFVKQHDLGTYDLSSEADDAIEIHVQSHRWSGTLRLTDTQLTVVK